MKLELCGLQVSLLAKEKGFDWKCSYFFNHEFDKNKWYEQTQYSFKVNFNLDAKDVAGYGETVSRPEQALLQKWLREVHRIHVLVKPWINMDHDDRYTATLLRDGVEGKWNPKCKGKDMLEESPFSFEEDTFEESLELALLEALKLIK